jgi:hypothetical protein
MPLVLVRVFEHLERQETRILHGEKRIVDPHFSYGNFQAKQLSMSLLKSVAHDTKIKLSCVR